MSLDHHDVPILMHKDLANVLTGILETEQETEMLADMVGKKRARQQDTLNLIES